LSICIFTITANEQVLPMVVNLNSVGRNNCLASFIKLNIMN